MIWDILAGPRYTEEELNSRLKFFIGIILGLTLFGIVFVVLYSLIFVTQPMNGMSPVDNKFFELIIPIATFLTGTLSGIMLAGGDKDMRMKAIEAANRPPAPSGPGASGSSVSSFGVTGGGFGAAGGFSRPSFGGPSPVGPVGPVGPVQNSFAPSSSFGQNRAEPAFNLPPMQGGKLMGPPQEPEPEL